MQELADDKMLEIIETYMDMIEKQDETIHHMGDLILRQAEELAQWRNLQRSEDMDE